MAALAAACAADVDVLLLEDVVPPPMLCCSASFIDVIVFDFVAADVLLFVGD